jgi:sigma-B regulation protein RsbU (phosphoserine phosphatase)
MIDDGHLAMVIADVSGEGVPAALFMMSSKILINDHALMGGSPAEILARVNKQVCANNEAHMFVTVWLGILEISTGKLTTASAGHEYPIINTTGKYELLKDKHGLAVGAFEMSKYKNTEIQLKKGDSIFVYTDGVAEATDANNELFGTDRTVEALNAIPEGASQKEILAGVRTAVDAFVKEAPQFDDLTMVGLKYNGPCDDAATKEQA